MIVQRNLIKILTLIFVLLIIFTITNTILAHNLTTKVIMQVENEDITGNEIDNNTAGGNITNYVNDGVAPETGDINLYLYVFLCMGSFIGSIVLIKVNNVK